MQYIPRGKRGDLTQNVKGIIEMKIHNAKCTWGSDELQGNFNGCRIRSCTWVIQSKRYFCRSPLFQS